MIPALLIAATISFTAPTHNASGPKSCVAGALPLTDLSHIEVQRMSADGPYRFTVYARVYVLPGEHVTMPVDGNAWFIVSPVDSSGNKGCWRSVWVP